MHRTSISSFIIVCLIGCHQVKKSADDNETSSSDTEGTAVNSDTLSQDDDSDTNTQMDSNTRGTDTKPTEDTTSTVVDTSAMDDTDSVANKNTDEGSDSHSATSVDTGSVVDSASSLDDQTDSSSVDDTGNATESGTQNVSDTDTTTDDMSDAASDTDPDSDTSFPNTVQQAPFTIRVVNNTDQVKYLYGDFPDSIFYISPLGYDHVSLVPPLCSYNCEGLTDAQSCCIECEQFMKVFVILPGEYVERTLSGYQYTRNRDLCGGNCSCHEERDPFASEYLFIIGEYDEIYCINDDCPVITESGAMWDVEVTGDATVHAIPLAIPFEENLIIVELTGERDIRCDDGSALECTEAAPTCIAAYEMLAIREGCWQCVNTNTCGAWPYPHCKTDDDCLSNEYCDDCANLACLECSSCTPGCVSET